MFWLFLKRRRKKKKKNLRQFSQHDTFFRWYHFILQTPSSLWSLFKKQRKTEGTSLVTWIIRGTAGRVGWSSTQRGIHCLLRKDSLQKGKFTRHSGENKQIWAALPMWTDSLWKPQAPGLCPIHSFWGILMWPLGALWRWSLPVCHRWAPMLLPNAKALQH